MGKSDYSMSMQPGYVLVKRPLDYEVVAKELPTMLMDLAAFCREADCRKVLVFGPRTKVNLEVLDIFDLGQELAKLDLQIAMVESHDVSAENVEFLENVVLNRGRPIRFFDTEKEARDWLRVS